MMALKFPYFLRNLEIRLYPKSADSPRNNINVNIQLQ